MRDGRACGLIPPVAALHAFVRPEGFEPPTFRSVAGRSNPLSYGRLRCEKTNAAGRKRYPRAELWDAEARGFEPRKGS
jgi:hypothetical protein